MPGVGEVVCEVETVFIASAEGTVMRKEKVGGR